MIFRTVTDLCYATLDYRYDNLCGYVTTQTILIGSKIKSQKVVASR
jgi:protein-arginine kinase